jgi:hypothetical protein
VDNGRTARILAAIAQELERRRGEIDGVDGLRQVSVTVRLARRNGMPQSVLCRTERETVTKVAL